MATPTLRRVIGRLVAAALAVGLVILAAALESDTQQLSARGTAAQIVQRYGPDAIASCEEKHGYWDYKCLVHGSKRTFTVDVRVDEHKIIDRSKD
jgi:invasion protein IalB